MHLCRCDKCVVGDYSEGIGRIARFLTRYVMKMMECKARAGDRYANVRSVLCNAANKLGDGDTADYSVIHAMLD